METSDQSSCDWEGGFEVSGRRSSQRRLSSEISDRKCSLTVADTVTLDEGSDPYRRGGLIDLKRSKKEKRSSAGVT